MMLNPYRRLLQECGMTQAEFCRQYDFSKPTLVGILTGQYPNLSERMVDSIFELCREKGVSVRPLLHDEYGTPDLNTAYVRWQIEERKAFAQKYAKKPERWNKNTSPFQAYIEDTAGAQATFCKELKTDAAAVRRYANGESLLMPGAIYDVLLDIEYPYLPDLIAAQANWRDENC